LKIKDAEKKIKKAKNAIAKQGKKAAKNSLKVAWKTAATVVESKYPCAAKLIKNSVDNKEYKETSKTKKKIFTNKIKKDSYYKEHINN